MDTKRKTRPRRDLNMEPVERLDNRVVALIDDDVQQIITEATTVLTVTTSYTGKSACGTPITTSQWKIFRAVYDSATGTTVYTWANGNGKYEHRWDQRASLDYL